MTTKKLRFSEIIFGLLIVLILLPANITISKSEDKYSVRQLNPGFKPQQLRGEDLKPVDLSKLDNSTLWMQSSGNGDVNLKAVQNSFDEYWKTHNQGKGSGWKPFKRAEYFWKMRTGSGEQMTGTGEQWLMVNGQWSMVNGQWSMVNGQWLMVKDKGESKMPNLTNIYKDLLERQTADGKKDKVQEENEWQFLGPLTKPQFQPYTDPSGMGRINCIAFHPRNPRNIWAGSAFGGVWHTTNGGGSWETFPFTNFMSIGISDIAIGDVSNTYTNIIFNPQTTNLR